MPIKRALIFPCGSEIGLEYCRALAYSTFFELHGASSVADHGAFSYEHHYAGLPYADDPALLPALRDLTVSRGIEFLIPAHDSLTVLFSQWQEEGHLGHLRVVGSPLETCRIVRSKALTYRHLRDVVAVPTVYPFMDDAASFPIFLKPDVGQGSRGTGVAWTTEEWTEMLRRDPSLIACEMLPGREYTIDCFTDRHGVLRFAGGRTRGRIFGGISVNSQPVKDPRFLEMAEAISGSLVFRGQWFFQVKERASGELVLMEVAARCSGTSGVFRGLGVNLPLLSLHDAADRNVSVRQNDHGIIIDRALAARARLDLEFADVFVDLDDTLLWRGGVNHRMVAVLYRFRNDGKALHLLTRHSARHQATAREAIVARGLAPEMFDRIIEVPEGVSKADYIDRRPAIFIDDSFAEREQVAASSAATSFDINQAIELFGDFH